MNMTSGFFEKHLRLVYVPAIILLTFFAYIGVYSFEYVWDDYALFLESASLRGDGWESTLRGVTEPILPGTTYFRPAVLFSFVVEFWLFDVNASVSHSVNVLIHLTNSVLLYFLAQKLLWNENYKEGRALLVLVIYALHPALIEPVAWVSGRFDLMVTTFCLLSLYSALSLERWRNLSVCLFFLLAALSKENAVIIPVAVMVAIYLAGRNNLSLSGLLASVTKEKKLFAGLVATGLFYIACRFFFLDALSHGDRNYDILTLVERLSFAGHTAAFYFEKVVNPFSDLNPVHTFDFDLLVGADFYVGLMWFGIYITLIFAPFIYTARPLVFLSLGLLALMPVINLAPLTIGGNIGHERFLTLPLVFFCISLGFFNISLSWFSFGAARRILLYGKTVLLIWVAASFFTIITTIPFWKNEVHLWQWAYEKNQASEFSIFSLVSGAVRKGDLDFAEQMLEEYLEKQASNKNGKVNQEFYISSLRGHIAQRRGRYPEALAYLESSVDELGNLPHQELSKHGIDVSEARIEKKSYELSWLVRFLFCAIAETKLGLRDFKGASEAAEIALFYQPDYAPAFLINSMALKGVGNHSKSLEYYNKAMKIYPADAQIDAKLIFQSFIDQL